MRSFKINNVLGFQGLVVTLPFVLFYGSLLLVAHYSATMPLRNDTPDSVGTLCLMQPKDPSYNRTRTIELKQSYKRYQKYQRILKESRKHNDRVSLASCRDVIPAIRMNYNSIAAQTNDVVFAKTGLPHSLPLTNID